ncbi:O-antigen ligase family protein [Polynucleobacter sinensis]|uniref:O-antigen ligase family protein n=1 Tax=Polynucleobacter sinensis TaxID=1743157 RepID=UPI000782E8F5|nr:O-antigen ligase family protein [Polynucleobacter sinensis]
MQSQSPTSNVDTYPVRVSGMVRMALVCSFALLWAIWIQPHTIALRHALLTIGSILGLYVIVQNYELLKTRFALPIYLIGLLFVWITFHLFFLSHQYELQLAEYLTIWKRIAWGAPFAIGLGIALGGTSKKIGVASDGYTRVWWVFYAGVVAPTAIYLTRTVLMLLAGKFDLQLPSAAMHMPGSSSWHITKMSLVFFCLPALAIACSQCIRLINQKSEHLIFLGILYGGTILAVLTVFYLENTKNGIAYSVMLIAVMLLRVAILRRSKWGWRDGIISVLAILAMVFFLAQHIQKNESWKTVFADVKVAQRLDEIDSWKYYGARGYPNNELGKTVSITNYERAAWAMVAVRLIGQLPQGYGLIYKSFGYYGKDKWPESTLFQAHSAWLDLTLGIGIPGVFLLVLAGVIALKNASKAWGAIALWMLLSITLLMTTTEVSQQVYIDALAFLILWTAGLGLHDHTQSDIN